MNAPLKTYPVSIPAWWALPSAIWWVYPKWHHLELFYDGRFQSYQVAERFP